MVKIGEVVSRLVPKQLGNRIVYVRETSFKKDNENVPLKKSEDVLKDQHRGEAYCMKCKSWNRVLDAELKTVDGKRGKRNYVFGYCYVCTEQISRFLITNLKGNEMDDYPGL